MSNEKRYEIVGRKLKSWRCNKKENWELQKETGQFYTVGSAFASRWQLLQIYKQTQTDA